jgi:hypothetical protein
MSDYTNAKISIAYPIQQFPPRGRVARLSWKKEPVQVDLRHCSKSELQLAFLINRVGSAGPIRVYHENGNLWWPVGSNEQDRSLFLDALSQGYQDVIGLIGARIRETYNWRMKDKIESREVVFSWQDDALSRAHLAAQNVLLVDGKRAYVRGGCPLFLFYGDRDSADVTYLDACNSGQEYGRPLPIELTGDRGAHYVDEYNVRMFVARGQVLPLGSTGDPRLARDPTRVVEIHCEVELSPFDLAEFQLQLLCRDLLESIDYSRHLPFEVRRDGLALHRLDREGRPTAGECVHAVTDLQRWLSELDPATRRKFRDATRLLRLRISDIDKTYRQSNRLSPFSLDPLDYEAIASLSF